MSRNRRLTACLILFKLAGILFLLLMYGYAISATSSFKAEKNNEHPQTASKLLLNHKQLTQVLSHGPWPPESKADLSNRFSTDVAAIELGAQLFFSTWLSKDNTISCSSCHSPETAFSSGKFIKENPTHLDRNTQSLLNTRFNRWFGWDGSNDNLWAQSIRPILNVQEMNLPIEKLKTALQNSSLKDAYQRIFGDISAQNNDLVLVNIGKALAAFQATLITKKTPFDIFRDAVANKDWDAAAMYPKSAQRGLSIFLGRGNCSFCHSGPLFTNGEFHDIGIPYFIRPGVVDKGRHQGIINLKNSAYTLASDYNDDSKKQGAWAVNNVVRQHSNFGIFRVPSLRGVSKTAPYMHNGSLTSLTSVVDHYNNIDIERLHADGEAILKPLNLTADEKEDLITFLQSLAATN